MSLIIAGTVLWRRPSIGSAISLLLNFYTCWVYTRENEGTEREAQGVGRDMSCPRMLFLDEPKYLF